MKKTFTTILIIILVGVGIYVLTQLDQTSNQPNPSVSPDTSADITPSPEASQAAENEGSTVLGSSVEGRTITAYHYGNGPQEILFIGGIHGGYEWNTVLLAYQAMDYFAAKSDIPQNLTITVIPVMNPDGLHTTTGVEGRFTIDAIPASISDTITGRFNAHEVDLSRNFDCDWQAQGVWQDRNVSGGEGAFSEPESKAIQNYVETRRPSAIITWYSAAGGVYSSSCHNGVSEGTKSLTSTYADASGYKGYESYDYYEITGDMVNWFAKENIPAISVLLTNHTDTEWNKNKAGIDAVLSAYAR